MTQPHLKHARTVAIARFLRAAAPSQHRRRGGRIPRQQQPDAIRREYFNAIDAAVLTPMRAVYQHELTEILRILVSVRRSDHTDDLAGSDGERARRLVEIAGKRAAAKFDPVEVKRIAERFGKRTSDFQREQFDRQIRQAIGVSYSAIERPTRDLVPIFAASNVELIKTVPERYQDRLARDVREAFESGMHPETLAQRFIDLDDMAESDARRIARDQIGKLNAQFNQDRQESLGVTSFVWRTANDNRVRDSHSELDGQTFDWNDPPEDDETGEVITPGSAIMCRCYAEPDLSDIVSATVDDQ